MKKIFFTFLPLIFLLNSCGKLVHEKFDSHKWQNSNLNLEENWDLRWRMMNDLRNSHKLVGMRKAEIEGLLGKPDSESNTEYYYYLGMTGTGINSGTLTILFGSNNLVIEIKVSQG